MVPVTSPNPIKAPSRPAQPRMVSVSPSRRNMRSSPPRSWIAFFPPCVCSRMLPSEPGVSPVMVPEPNKSPGRKLHPVMVWWAIIWGQDQRRCFELDFEMVVLSPLEATHVK